ncbi:hypothetical protein [Nannocystis radixulma]|uniref:Uncharacterized protein n=1 Tax=Nannocystis radixulma TaxID=2995305 RepID=A0ABT5BLI7_9BACT|nr:hypothetical protein [Nannocystis radixulma]MDC0675028.1 hypothetical protein [Nannocystis radixulma]
MTIRRAFLCCLMLGACGPNYPVDALGGAATQGGATTDQGTSTVTDGHTSGPTSTGSDTGPTTSTTTSGSDTAGTDTTTSTGAVTDTGESGTDSAGSTFTPSSGWDGDDQWETGTTEPVDVTDTDGAANACGTIEDEDTVPELCPRVKYSCGTCEGQPPLINDYAALTCTLKALRDRTSGRVSWHDSSDDFTSASNADIVILADGTALIFYSGADDFCSYTSSYHVVLRPPDHFTLCLAQPTPGQRFTCMQAAVLGPLFKCEPSTDECTIIAPPPAG